MRGPSRGLRCGPATAPRFGAPHRGVRARPRRRHTRGDQGSPAKPRRRRLRRRREVPLPAADPRADRPDRSCGGTEATNRRPLRPLGPGARPAAPRPTSAARSRRVAGREWRGDPRAIPLARHAQIVLQVGPRIPPHPSHRFPLGPMKPRHLIAAITARRSCPYLPQPVPMATGERRAAQAGRLLPPTTSPLRRLGPRRARDHAPRARGRMAGQGGDHRLARRSQGGRPHVQVPVPLRGRCFVEEFGDPHLLVFT